MQLQCGLGRGAGCSFQEHIKHWPIKGEKVAFFKSSTPCPTRAQQGTNSTSAGLPAVTSACVSLCITSRQPTHPDSQTAFYRMCSNFCSSLEPLGSPGWGHPNYDAVSYQSDKVYNSPFGCQVEACTLPELVNMRKSS